MICQAIEDSDYTRSVFEDEAKSGLDILKESCNKLVSRIRERLEAPHTLSNTALQYLRKVTEKPQRIDPNFEKICEQVTQCLSKSVARDEDNLKTVYSNKKIYTQTLYELFEKIANDESNNGRIIREKLEDILKTYCR